MGDAATAERTPGEMALSRANGGRSSIRTLLLDIETIPMVAYIFDPRTEYVSEDKIVSHGRTACWSAAWLDDNGDLEDIIFDAEWRRSGNEGMIRHMHRLLLKADAAIHYNGNKFDIGVLNREFLQLGLPPPPPSKQIDLFPVVKRRFKFAYNGLDSVCRRLGIGKKIGNEKGMDLWRGVMDGRREDRLNMEAYNRNDIVLLHALYKRLLPWIPNHPNRAAFDDITRPSCPKCKSRRMQRRGYAVTTTLKYPRFQCRECGSWSRGKDAVSKPSQVALRPI